jgi:hypothetical protein
MRERKILTRNDLVSLLYVYLAIMFSSSYLYDVLAISPSFDHQQIEDIDNDMSIIRDPQDVVPNIDVARYLGECQLAQNDYPPDISGITYTSDGKRLNATLWLSSPTTKPTFDKYQEKLWHICNSTCSECYYRQIC